MGYILSAVPIGIAIGLDWIARHYLVMICAIAVIGVVLIFKFVGRR